MNTLWIFSADEPNLRERLMGMEFDRAILSEMAQLSMNEKAHILSRVGMSKNSNVTTADIQELKAKIALLAARMLTGPTGNDCYIQEYANELLKLSGVAPCDSKSAMCNDCPAINPNKTCPDYPQNKQD